jgi:hypothetical protein
MRASVLRIDFDALRVKIREDNVVRNKAVYLALGVRPDGTREILGLRIRRGSSSSRHLLQTTPCSCSPIRFVANGGKNEPHKTMKSCN